MEFVNSMARLNGETAVAEGTFDVGEWLRTGVPGHPALHDSLTDLPSQALFDDRLDQAILTAVRREQPLALLVLDLDRFKPINGSMDDLLPEVALRLQGVLRESDTVARLEGEVLAVLLPNTDAGGAEVVAQKMLGAVEESIVLDGQQLDFRTSIGIAVCPEHGTEAGSLKHHADVAMYAARRCGQGYSVYTNQAVPVKSQTRTGKLLRFHQHGDGSIHALCSEGAELYTVRVGVDMVCNCPVGSSGRSCAHVTAASERFASLWPALRLDVVDPNPDPPHPGAPAAHGLLPLYRVEASPSAYARRAA